MSGLHRYVAICLDEVLWSALHSELAILDLLSDRGLMSKPLRLVQYVVRLKTDRTRNLQSCSVR